MNPSWARRVAGWARAGVRPLVLLLVSSIVPFSWHTHGSKLFRRVLGQLAGPACPTGGWRHRALRWAKVGAALLVAAAFFSTVPVWPWRPTCGGRLIIGDYRDIYVDEFASWLDSFNVYHWRFGDVIVVRALPWLDGDEYWGQAAVILNGEKRLAEALSDDQTISGVLYPAPAGVTRLKKELEPIIGPDRRFAPDGTQLVYGSDTRVGRNCQLFRAAILEPAS